MYGLFFYHYDYYEWEELVCVSEDFNKLVEHGTELEKAEGYPFVNSDLVKHGELARKEKRHYLIGEVKVI